MCLIYDCNTTVDVAVVVFDMNISLLQCSSVYIEDIKVRYSLEVPQTHQ